MLMYTEIDPELGFLRYILQANKYKASQTIGK